MIRKARVSDVVALHKLINEYADRGDMLHRSLNDLYENIRDYFVVELEGRVVGSCALHVSWEDLAEIKSLVVADEAQGSGLGRQLLDQCLNEANELGIPRVFALTYKPEFFEKLGFVRADKSGMPHKIWSECINCPKFPDCGEEAVVRDL
ncbi:MAG: N-acetyltransferase [Armatimonadetes bacterium]|nr:N-acetyltransferase [Armatimonadota bacterium]